MAPPTRSVSVCLFYIHPVLASACETSLAGEGFRLQMLRMHPSRLSDLQNLPIPRASVYLIDSNTHQFATQALAANILTHFPGARMLILAEKFTEASAFPLMRLGAKGLLRFDEAARFLRRAVHEVAGGGFWVPRTLLSRFVDATLNAGRRLARSAVELTRREHQVLSALLANLSNKEIAKQLQISERTAKFHVSNLLEKYGVKRRADLILLNLTLQVA
jgi:two-component system nitrate/nitrite response regulator NarL